MKRLKLFPKTFLYTLVLMLFIVCIAHGLIYLLAPRMQTVFSSGANASEDIILSINEVNIIAWAIKRALPLSLIFSLQISAVCSLLFSKALAEPIKKISFSAEKMMKLEKGVSCPVKTKDEIGMLAENVNKLYNDLLATIESLEREKNTVRDMEREKADFLRAASHELKTPVTALSAILENMILGVGKYRDYGLYLPKCKEITEKLSKMIYNILEASKINTDYEKSENTDVSALVKELCEPFQMIASARGIKFSADLSIRLNACISVNQFKKALSNIIANAVQYTESGKRVFVYIKGRTVAVENECRIISGEEINKLFEPFYRHEFSRDKETGGNGLGLYIADRVFKTLGIRYRFEAMEDYSGMRFILIFD